MCFKSFKPVWIHAGSDPVIWKRRQGKQNKALVSLHAVSHAFLLNQLLENDHVYCLPLSFDCCLILISGWSGPSSLTLVSSSKGVVFSDFTESSHSPSPSNSLSLKVNINTSLCCLPPSGRWCLQLHSGKCCQGAAEDEQTAHFIVDYTF